MNEIKVYRKRSFRYTDVGANALQPDKDSLTIKKISEDNFLLGFSTGTRERFLRQRWTEEKKKTWTAPD